MTITVDDTRINEYVIVIINFYLKELKDIQNDYILHADRICMLDNERFILNNLTDEMKVCLYSLTLDRCIQTNTTSVS